MPGGDYRDALRERAGWVPEAGPLLDADGERVGEHGGTAGVHRRPAPGPRRRARRAALRQPDRPADQHDHARSARGPRDDHDRPRAGDASSPATRRRGRRRRSAPRSGSATAPRRSPATVRPATADEPARGGRWIVETDTPGLGRRTRPGRRPVRRRRRPRWRADRAADAPAGRRTRRGRTRSSARSASRSVSIGPALILAVLVGIFHAALYVLIRGNAGGRLPIIVVAAILGAWAGDALGGPARLRRADDRRLPPARRVDRGLDRDRRSRPRSRSSARRSVAHDRALTTTGPTASFLRGLTHRRDPGRDPRRLVALVALAAPTARVLTVRPISG